MLDRTEDTESTTRIGRTEVEIDLVADDVARAAIAEMANGDATKRLEAAHRLRVAADALVTELVIETRSGGYTWAEIGEILGVSTQAVHQKYRHLTGVSRQR